MTSDDVDSTVRVAESYVLTGNLRQAEQTVRTALATDPNNPRLLTVYARVKLGQSDYAAAADCAHAALAVAPENEHAMRVYSRALELQGRIPDALWMAWRTVTAHPHSHLAHHNHARLLADAGRPAEAMVAIDEALRLDPSDANAVNLRGDIHLALGQVDRAEVDYREALRLNPGDASAVHNLAVLRHGRGRRWGAIRGFLGAGRLDPAFGDVARQNVGVVLTGVLRRSTWMVLIVSFAVIYTSTMHDDGHPTVVPRIIAGGGALLLLVTFTRMVREVPRPLLKSVRRQRKVLVIRALQLVAGLALGALTAAVGALTVPAVLASILVLSLPIVVIVGGITGERLW